MASKRRRAGRPRRAAPPPAGRVEARMLRLARDLAALARDATPPAAALDAALARLAAAHAPGTLGRPHTSRTGRPAAAALALAWAREQVRLPLADLLARAAGAGAARRDAQPEALAWLLLAGAEALAHEPPDAVDDRLETLRTLIRPADAPVRAPR